MNGDPLEVLHVEDNPNHARLVMRSLRDHRAANFVHVAVGSRLIQQRSSPRVSIQFGNRC